MEICLNASVFVFMIWMSLVPGHYLANVVPKEQEGVLIPNDIEEGILI